MRIDGIDGIDEKAWERAMVPVKRVSARPCRCGCGKLTVRRERLIRTEDRGTADALRWTAGSIDPMRYSVALVRGHESADHVAASEEG
jgi:hypothetical protein